MRHEIEWTTTAAVASEVERTHDALGVALPDDHPMRKVPDRRYVVGRGTANGKPFCAGHVFDATASFKQKNFWAFGHQLTPLEHDAIRRSMEKLPRPEVDPDRPVGPLTEIHLQREFMEGAKAWLVVPFELKDAAKRLGAMWDGGAHLWHTMDGVDPTPFEAAGIGFRPAPEWRRVDGSDRSHSGALKSFGCRWTGEAWYVDVATAGEEALREIRQDLGLRIMESQHELWDWKTLNGWNARPAPDAFPEWEGAPSSAPTPGP